MPRPRDRARPRHFERVPKEYCTFSNDALRADRRAVRGLDEELWHGEQYGELGLRVHSGTALFGRFPGLLGELLDCRDHERRLEGLDDPAFGAGIAGPLDGFWLSLRGEHDDGDFEAEAF